MEDEEGYTALTFQAKRNASRTASPAKKQVPSQGLRWQLVTLWVIFIEIVILVVAFRVFVLQLEAEKRKCNCSSESFQSLLRSRICNQSKGNSSENSLCQICSPHWHLHRDKCYWLSKDLKSWRESQSDCSEKGAQLAVPQDEEEKEFLKSITEDTEKYWIGLFLSEKKWRWITSRQLDQNMFQELRSAREASCGRIKSSIITPNYCNAAYKWICQKDPILL